MFARHLDPPYWAVIFTNLRKPGDHGYSDMGARMVELAAQMPGYLGIESARNTEGFGITVSYWKDEASLLAWRAHLEHRVAQDRGKHDWYEHYELRVAKVERGYSGPEGR